MSPSYLALAAALLAVVSSACVKKRDSREALAEQLRLAHEAAANFDHSAYVTEQAAGSVLGTSLRVPCAHNGQNNFNHARIQSPTTIDGNTAHVDVSQETWEFNFLCRGDPELGEIFLSMTMKKKVDDDAASGTAALKGSIETDDAGTCDFDFELDYDAGSGEAVALAGKFCGRKAENLDEDWKVPVFRP